IIYDRIKKRLNKRVKPGLKRLLRQVLYQMEIFNAVVCIPSYFQKELLGILLLGAKRNGRSFKQDEIDFFIALSSDVAMAIRNAQLFRELRLELERKQKLFINTTIALAAAIDAKDHYTHGHTSRVTSLSLLLAEKLKQNKKNIFPERFFEQLHIASLLHDIGKIGIPEHILNKKGPLNEEEKRLMQEHTLVGVNILQPIKELEDSILGIKYHHEAYDGSGYPEGLKGEQIPLIASIISVADAYDAMTSDRPYRSCLSKQEAIEEIKSQSGKKFNPQVVYALVKLYEEGKL
ncbi:MAG: HD domain-containing protein, partial [Candidatus Omnitrophica bacterium]|nr:HD domain-containing protein [Candidatus Omnitrophota bacterium]